MTSKLNEIEKSIQDLSDMGDVADAERRDAFDKDMTPDQIKTFSIKNRLPKNVIYKMLEKYHYLTFLKKCKKILDDGEVTDAEIDSLRKEENGHRPVQEALDKTSKLVFAYGRFNPPTIGHDKLMREVITQARKNGANHIVYASASTDKRKNPLDQATKDQVYEEDVSSEQDFTCWWHTKNIYGSVEILRQDVRRNHYDCW